MLEVEILLKYAVKRVEFLKLHEGLSMSKKWWVVIIVVLVVVAGLIAAPYLINVDTYRGVVESKLSQAIGRQVSLNDLRLSVAPLAIESKDVRISDDPSFRKDDFVQIQSLRLHLNFWPLLRRQIQVTSLELLAPNVWLVKNPQGVWNFSTLGGKKSAASQVVVIGAGVGAATSDGVTGFDVSNLSVKKGRVVITDQAHPKELSSFDILDFSARDISSNVAFPFSLTVAGSEFKEPLRIEGKAGPLDPANMADSPLEGTLEAKTFQYGKISVENLHGKFAFLRQVLKLDPLDFDLYRGHHSGTVTLNFRHPEMALASSSRLATVDANQLLSSTSTAKDFLYGLINGNFTLSHPGGKESDWLRGISGKAFVDLQKGKLAHLSIGHEVLTIAKLGGINFPEGETPITKMSGNFDIADNWAHTQDLHIATQDIDLLCQGGISFDNELKLDVTATFSQEASLRMKSTSPVGGLLDAFLADKNKQIVIPFQVTGTAQKPHFKLDSQKLLSTNTNQVPAPDKIQSTIQSLQGLFKKKKN
jgi:uncharacterized protein involved in outer membrane biogenesis